MTASEIAFMALGLLLGVATGAALIEVLRSRPPSRREVRITVTPNSVARRRAATLAEIAPSDEPNGPARGGPGDRRWLDRDMPAEDDTAVPAGSARSIDTGGVADTRGAGGSVADRTRVPAAPPPPFRLAGAGN